MSFDWQIGRFAGHDLEKKSRWPEGVLGQNHYIRSEKEAILPVAVQAAGACIDWMLQSDRINPDGIGVAGISWGGYLSWLIAAYEPRIRAAVPVYGCGGHFDERHRGHFRLAPKMHALWQENWDPYSIPHRQSKPVCYLSCTNDFFGICTIANDLMNRLKVPHRRGWLPNCNHSIGPGESALGLAWLKHYLDRGPAIPAEPVLSADFRIEADQPEAVAGTETWWTPELRDGDLGCWIRGIPQGPFAAAYGRVNYKQGYTLSTPLITSQAQAQSHSQFQSLADGLGWNWGMGSTQFYGNDVRMQELADGSVLLNRAPGNDHDARSFYLNQFAHPGWNTGRQKAVTLGVRPDPCEAITEATVTLTLRSSANTQEITTILPVRDDMLKLDFLEFAEFPPIHTWRSVVRAQIQMKTRAKGLRIGPLEIH